RGGDLAVAAGRARRGHGAGSGLSVWLDGPAPARRVPLEGDATADVAIVGGGIAGLSVAYALARAGARPIVLERDALGGAASGRNGGFILAGVAESFSAACRRFGLRTAERVWDVTVRNRELIRDAVRRHGIECDLAWNGSVQLAGDDDEWRDIRASAEALEARGVGVALDGPGRCAVYEEDGEMHPVRFVRGLADAAERLGARIHEGTAVRRIRADGAVTDHGTVSAGAVVSCTNAYTDHLIAGARIAPVRGQMLATAPVAERIFPRPVYAHRGYRYWRQTRDGRILVGGWRNTAVDVEVGEVALPTPRIQQKLDGFLVEQGVRAEVTHRWAGIMGFSHDGLPYIGRRSSGVYLLAGFTGHGNAFAMAGGEMVATLIRTGSHPDADLFDPERP
ncbi:MAG: FAD-binding oxidoreductase, partial [Lysobacteraceae bacterium]